MVFFTGMDLMGITGGKKLKAHFNALATNYSGSVNVGILKNNNPTYDNNQTAANVGFTQEFGGVGYLPDGMISIPPRPFMSQTKEENKNILKEEFKKNGLNIEATMEKVGSQMQAYIKNKIENWSTPFPHNSLRTIHYKGFDKPLVHTGTLKGAINYEVKKVND